MIKIIFYLIIASVLLVILSAMVYTEVMKKSKIAAFNKELGVHHSICALLEPSMNTEQISLHLIVK